MFCLVILDCTNKSCLTKVYTQVVVAWVVWRYNTTHFPPLLQHITHWKLKDTKDENVDAYIHTLKYGNHLILSTTRFKQSHFEANTHTQVYAHPFKYTNNEKTSLFNGALYILSSNIFVHVLFILDCNAMTHVSNSCLEEEATWVLIIALNLL